MALWLLLSAYCGPLGAVAEQGTCPACPAAEAAGGTEQGGGKAAATPDDPTRPPMSAAVATAAGDGKSTTALRLDSTITSPRRRHAIINGLTVGLGERIGNAEIVEIRPGEVRLREGEQTRVLSLYTLVVKRSDSIQFPSPQAP